jgi:uncharacterized RDD family membrane protein YckC
MPSGPPRADYASWGTRLGAYLLDGLLVFLVMVVPLVAGLVVAFRDVEIDPVTDELTSFDAAGLLIVALGLAVGLAVELWNRVFRQGRRGQSLGKQALGITVVAATHGGPIGLASSFGRWAMQSVVPGVLPFVGFVYTLVDGLFPLWDERHQAVHDKAVGSVVVHAR